MLWGFSLSRIYGVRKHTVRKWNWIGLEGQLCLLFDRRFRLLLYADAEVGLAVYFASLYLHLNLFLKLGLHHRAVRGLRVGRIRFLGSWWRWVVALSRRDLSYWSEKLVALWILLVEACLLGKDKTIQQLSSSDPIGIPAVLLCGQAHLICFELLLLLCVGPTTILYLLVFEPVFFLLLR